MKLIVMLVSFWKARKEKAAVAISTSCSKSPLLKNVVHPSVCPRLALTSGHKYAERESARSAEARTSLHAHWHHDSPSDSGGMFQQYWDALPPLTKPSRNRTRSLQLHMDSAATQEAPLDLKVSNLDPGSQLLQDSCGTT